ncbi:MAG TPA: hypothetical protein PK141_00470 [Polyangiaceae bacterium]|nr:hypothetical protein [Polyangiaceae bacterium]
MKTLDELDRLYVAATAGEWESVLCDAPHVNDEVRMIEGPVTRANGKKFVPVISRISPTADADFIAAAKNTWPAISARLRAAEAALASERTRWAVEEEEWRKAPIFWALAARKNERLAAEAMRVGLAECERLREALYPIATGRFASVREACDIAEAALGAEAVAAWNAAENARAALGEP